MKKFEEFLKEKAHLNKIKNAKKTVPNTVKNSTLKVSSTKVNDEAKLLIKLFENKNYDSIPAYKLLRTANLQQYTKGFILRGYGINLGKLACLTAEEKAELFADLKVLPGHTVKLDKIIKTIAKQSNQNAFEGSQVSQINSIQKQSPKQKSIYSSVNKKPKIEDAEYEIQLQRIFNQYTPLISEIKNKSSKTEKRSSMLPPHQESKYSKTKYIPPKPISKASEGSMTNVDVKRKVNEISTKSTIRKSQSVSNSQKQNKNLLAKQQSARETLNRLLQGVAPESVVQTKMVMQIDLQLNNIKNLYKSFDGALMSSTITNLDIQQLVYAFAGYVGYRVIAMPQPEAQKKFENPFQLNLNNLNIEQPHQQDSLDNQQPIEDEIGQILRESYMHPLYREASVCEKIDYEQVCSEGENDDQNLNLNNQFGNDKSIQSKMMQSSFLGTQSHHFGFEDPLRIFDQPEPTDIDYFKPTVDSIFNFIKNIVLSAKMERQIPVMAATYLDNFLQKSKISLTSFNYKRILVICLLLASKVWDDESFQTPSFSKTFPEYSTILLNEMQKQMLKILEYRLKINKRQYALSYFKLRRFIKKNIKSYQNRKLNIKIINQLQNGVKNQYKTNLKLKRNSF